MLQTFQNLTRREVVFSLKSFAAALLALYISLRLNFSQPIWSVTTVYIVSQPLAGMVLSKSVYSVLGTVIGAVASLVFVALFNNSPELFCLALALWIGLGTTITIYLRDAPQAYAGMLSGYSAAIIGLPAALAPDIGVVDPAIRQLEGKLLALLAMLMSVYDRFAALVQERPATADALRPMLEKAAAHMAQTADAKTAADAQADRLDETALHREIDASLPDLSTLRADTRSFLVRSMLLRLGDVLDLWRDAVR